MREKAYPGNKSTMRQECKATLNKGLLELLQWWDDRKRESGGSVHSQDSTY